MEIICGGEDTYRTSESQFVAGLSGACGCYAGASAVRWAKQDTSVTGYMVYQELRKRFITDANGNRVPLCDAQGITNLYKLRIGLVNAYGVQCVLPASGETIQQFLDRMAGRAAVIWETHNGIALWDVLTGLHENAQTLENHILVLYGKNTGGKSIQYQAQGKDDLPAGYWCADSDNFSQNKKPIASDGTLYHWPINTRLVYYQATTVVRSLPIDAFAVLASEGMELSPIVYNQTIITQLTLSNAMSLQDIAQVFGITVDWLKSWNHQLANTTQYTKVWWTLPVGTVINIPHAG